MADQPGSPQQLWPCPNCKAEIPGTSQFCPSCGHQLVTQEHPGPAQQQTTVTTPPPAKRGWSTRKKVAVFAGVGLLVLMALAAVRGPTPPRPATEPGAVPVAPGATPRPQPAAQPVTLVRAQGSGTQNTRPFNATGPWTLNWTYDCTGSVFDQGNFIVTLYTPPERLRAVTVNELGDKDQGSNPVYTEGELYLSVSSGCDWTLEARQP
jgi:hypothetical protein